MAFFKAVTVLLALCLFGESFAGKTRQRRSHMCQQCPVLQNPSQPHCSIPTLCDHGHCSIQLNRCGAEYINVHYGQNIDLSLFDKGPNYNSYEETNNDNSVYKEIYYNPDTQMINPVTADHVRNSKYIYTTADDLKNLYASEATTNSLNEELIENFADEDDIASINAGSSGTKKRITLHIHKVGCKKCGKPYTCWDNDDCKDLVPNAYCYKANGRNSAGICFWKHPEYTNNGLKLVSTCCET